nr:hypothetical protein [Tanacetum cinerariifolium]
MNEYKGIMPTKIELTLKQSQQGISNGVLVSTEGVEERKRNVWIKGENKEAIHTTLGRNQVFTVKMEILLEPTSNKLLVGDLREDAEGTECLPTATIFEQLTLIGAKTTAWNEFSSTMASAIFYLATNQKFNFSNQVEGILKHKEIYITPSHTKKIFANTKRQGKDFSGKVTLPSHTKKIFGNTKRQGKDFSGKVTPLFDTMMVQPQEDMDEHVTTTSNDLLLSGNDRLKLTELMELCTQLQSRILTLETTKANQALKIRSLKRRVKKLEKKANKKTHKLKRLYKIDFSTRVESSEDAGLCDQEDASKHGRMIIDLDADERVALVDETQWRNDHGMFDTSILDDEEVVAKKEVGTADPVPTADEIVTTVGEVVTTAGVKVSIAAITSQIYMDKITLAEALIDIKTSKPKAKGIVIQEPSETPIPIPIDSSQKPSKAKDKGKAKMIEPEKPLKMKD